MDSDFLIVERCVKSTDFILKFFLDLCFFECFVTFKVVYLAKKVLLLFKCMFSSDGTVLEFFKVRLLLLWLLVDI